MAGTLRASTSRYRVAAFREGSLSWRTDVLAGEEPLEIRLFAGEGSPGVRVAVTMRTPGSDFELAAGFLLSEGVLQDRRQVRAISYCTDPALDPEQNYNVVNVYLQPGVTVDVERLRRHGFASSGCGICGKAAIEHVRAATHPLDAGDGPVLAPEVVARLGEALRSAQQLFDRTGGLHAAGLFDGEGRLLVLREDVGRHNAVDKVIGWAFLEGMLPLSRHVLMVSGRAGFEIVQKAAMAGIPVLAAVSAPSSLACRAARELGMTLVGFARGPRFNVYAGWHRLRLPVAQGAALAGAEGEEGAP